MFRFARGGKKRRVLVIGLDCAAPDLIFEQFLPALPTFKRLMDAGTWGELESCVPCITVPAWASMTTGRDPGVLGCYGFRNRADRGYGEMLTADSRTITEPRLWDILGERGRESVVLNVPQTHPIKPLNGRLVSCFLTPGVESAFAYPAILKQEVLRIVPAYRFDVRGFRTDDKAWLHQALIDLTELQYRFVRHALTAYPWDFFMHVNIALDRMHHGFWRYFDAQHRLYEAGNRFETVIRDYYVLLDGFIADLIERAGDDTTVLIVSDHGAKRMDGGICINQWLWRNGWLVLKTPPPAGDIIRFEDADVEWSRTRAWSSGGYYARVFLNVQGREPAGIIPPESVESVTAELSAALKTIPSPDGAPLDTQVFQPAQIYAQVNGIAPDLLVYFGNLHWRAVGGLGYEGFHTLENDTGPDDANHAQNGMFILYEPQRRGAGKLHGSTLYDIAPTLLHRLGERALPGMTGRVIQP